jgi:hypothetical protein
LESGKVLESAKVLEMEKVLALEKESVWPSLLELEMVTSWALVSVHRSLLPT